MQVTRSSGRPKTWGAPTEKPKGKVRVRVKVRVKVRVRMVRSGGRVKGKPPNRNPRAPLLP